MSRFSPFVLVAALSLTPAVYAAADPMDACSKETNDAARLACFDKAMAARRQAQPAPSLPAASTSTPRTPATVAPTPPAASGGNTAPPLPADLGQPPVRHAKPKAVEYSATVTKVDPRPAFGYSLVLDNGQVWETTEARSDLLVNEHESITIKPAGAGGFLMKTAHKQIVRVHRVR